MVLNGQRRPEEEEGSVGSSNILMYRSYSYFHRIKFFSPSAFCSLLNLLLWQNLICGVCSGRNKEKKGKALAALNY